MSNFEAFVDNEIEAAYSHFFTGEDSLVVDDGENVVDKSTLKSTVEGGVGAHGGSSVDFDEPGLKGFIDHEIVAVQFEAVPTGQDILLNCLKRSNDNVFDLCETPVNLCGIVPGEKVVLKVVQQPLPSPHLVVFLAVLLDLHIGEMSFQLADVLSVVGLVGKACEPTPIQPGSEVTVVGAEAVDPEVELLAAEK